MQHVYGHGGNLGNEYADHAAALGTYGLTSSHIVATRWIQNYFDASVCFDGCNNITKVLERLVLCSPSGSKCFLCSSRVF